ncbi:MAG: hypothetical protein H7Z14_05720 [Anaerolineae bacterium]|nr:hypothetical protein [Phycisphaerae bacterium]
MISLALVDIQLGFRPSNGWGKSVGEKGGQEDFLASNVEEFSSLLHDRIAQSSARPAIAPTSLRRSNRRGFWPLLLGFCRRMILLPRGLRVFAANSLAVLLANVPTASAIQILFICSCGFLVAFDFVKFRGRSQRAKVDAATEVSARPGNSEKMKGCSARKRDRIEQNEPIRIRGQSDGYSMVRRGRGGAAEGSGGGCPGAFHLAILNHLADHL